MKRCATARRAGFSLIEVLVATAIAAAVITAAVMIFQNLTAGGPRSSYETVTVGASLPIFYGGTDTALDVYVAPSYGRAAQAEIVRDQFMEDLQRASAVFCLGREEANTIHPTEVPLLAPLQDPGGSIVGTSETSMAFRLALEATFPAAASLFVPYRGASEATNVSIFILVPSEAPRAAIDDQPEVVPTLSVLAVYDIDLTPTTSPAGTYASVKRYRGAALTDYYDVFYPKLEPDEMARVAFNPLAVAFERATRSSVPETDKIDRLKKAAERPFYFIWWPDPSAPALEAAVTSDFPPSYLANDPRASYAAMGGRTAFFFVVPMFPSL